MLEFLPPVSVYHYSAGSIDLLTARVRKHHAAAFLIFTVALSAADIAHSGLRKGSISAILFSLVMIISWFGSRRKGWQRTAHLFRSTEFEIDEEKASWRNNLRNRVVYRSEVTEARFSKDGIVLQGESRRSRILFPPEIEDFDKLSADLERWVPEQAVRRWPPPSSAWTYLRAYGVWTGAAVLPVPRHASWPPRAWRGTSAGAAVGLRSASGKYCCLSVDIVPRPRS